VVTFLSPPDNSEWLGILRIGLGAEVTLYCASLWADWNYLFAGSGQAVITRQLSEAIISTESLAMPTVGRLVATASHFGIKEETAMLLAWGFLLGAGVFLAAGILSRASAIVAWFLHLCVAKSGGMVSYGVDSFMTIGLFYLMLAPLPDRYALDRKLWGGRALDPGRLGFFRRVLQVHLCVVYLFSGITKSLGVGWWDGSNIWRALIRPPFNILSPDLIAAWGFLLPAIGISICLIEIGYPVLIWSKRTRGIWLALVCSMHLATGLTMGMHLFAITMIVLNVSAFGPGLRSELRASLAQAPPTLAS